MSNGHCIAFVKHGKQWWEFDDDTVTLVSEKEVNTNKKEQPYLLFFKRS